MDFVQLTQSVTKDISLMQAHQLNAKNALTIVHHAQIHLAVINVFQDSPANQPSLLKQQLLLICVPKLVVMVLNIT
jgi:hypothetical protein